MSVFERRRGERAHWPALFDLDAQPRSHRWTASLVVAAWCLVALVCRGTFGKESAEGQQAGADAVDYMQDIRPILAEHCLACHGPDQAARQAGLRLDVRQEAVDRGAIQPGDVAGSELIERINLPAEDEMAMPPPEGHKRLSDQQRQLLADWIAAGAEYQEHWAYIAPSRPPLPVVERDDWPENPIDRFILAELERAGLQPAAPADLSVLARRVALDLTGLPPSIEQVELLLDDPSPEAYQRYVDSLLKSKRYGEHRARYWLDYARYADTHGIHFDNYREIWSYRDWVIEAFNRNLPFDQFTTEQLAGDLLPEPTLQQRIATGFNRCNITTNEGGIIDEEYKVLYARDRTETTSLVWMGLTAGCAVCHDHKFDPLSQTEFYELSAFFNNTTQPVRDGNVPDTPPIIPVPRLQDRERFPQLQVELADAQQQVDGLRQQLQEPFGEQLSELDADPLWDGLPSEGLQLQALLGEGAGPAVQLLDQGLPRLRVADKPLQWAEGHVAPAALQLASDAVVDLGDVAGAWEHDQAFSYGAWIQLSDGNTGGAILARMDEEQEYRGFDLWLEKNRVGAHIIHAWPDDALKVVTSEPLPTGRWHHVLVTYDGSGQADGLNIYVDGQRRADRSVQAKSLSGTIRNQVPLRLGARSKGSTPAKTRLNDVRMYDRMLADEEVAQLATESRIAYLAALPAKKLDEPQTEELFAWWLHANSPEFRDASAQLATLQQEDAEIRQAGTIAHVMVERDEPAEAHFLHRGEYDQRGDRVTPDVPAVFPPLAEDLPNNRLGLAKWLLSADHPLTARVTVNRYWQEVFGRGLVESSDDFGIMGTLPSHPELLDWLAVDFRESGWDVKRLLRMMVTSATYRQRARVDKSKLASDPENRLLSRGPRFRMDAEMIRDYALEVSGLLSSRIGGPSVKPYQPEGVWEAVAMRGSNTRNYRRDDGEALYRRSMYTFWKRSAPPAAMDIFDAPSREVCTIRRDRTNTPLQALATLNDPQLIEAARQLAARGLNSSSEPSVRLQWMARRVLARPLQDEELRILSESLDELLEHYSEHPEDASELISVGASPVDEPVPADALAAYTIVANQLLNLDETLNK